MSNSDIRLGLVAEALTEQNGVVLFILLFWSLSTKFLRAKYGRLSK